jgi:hypothetical protein
MALAGCSAAGGYSGKGGAVEGRSTILIDAPAGSTIDVGFLEGLGHDVAVCHGPHEGAPCPILFDGSCPMVDAAHGIVFELDLNSRDHREILAEYRRRLPDDVPIRVATSPEQARQHAALLAEVQVWTRDPTVGDLDGFAALVETADRFREVDQAL